MESRASATSAREAFAQLSNAQTATDAVGGVVKPYPGIRSFVAQEESIFFGRDADVSGLIRLLDKERFVFVLGGSGSGKSSLVRAGLTPTLTINQPIGKRVGPWYVITFTPQNDALRSLGMSWAKSLYVPLLLDAPPDEAPNARENMAERAHEAAMEASRRRKAAALAGLLKMTGAEEDAERIPELLAAYVDDTFAATGSKLGPFLYEKVRELDALLHPSDGSRSPNLMIVVDQFEEIFRDEANRRAAGALVGMLSGLDEAAVEGLYVVVTMRSEEVSRCADFIGLSDLMTRSSYYVELPDEIATIVTRPVKSLLRLHGLTRKDDVGVAPAALRKVLDGVAELDQGEGARADHLPLVQGGLRMLWRRALGRWRSGDVEAPLAIEDSDFQGLATVKPTGAPDFRAWLNQSADGAYAAAIATLLEARFPRWRAERLIAASFIALERRDDRGNVSRRFASLSEMLESADETATPENETALAAALKHFIDETLLFRETAYEGPLYHISHEAVIRNWAKYRQWLREADRIRRIVEGTLERIWESKTKSGRTRSEAGDWLPKLSPASSAEQLTVDQIEILDGVYGRRPALGPAWMRRMIRAFVDRTTKMSALFGGAPGRERPDESAIEAWLAAQVEAARKRHGSTTRRTALAGAGACFVILLIGSVIFWGLYLLDLRRYDERRDQASQMVVAAPPPGSPQTDYELRGLIDQAPAWREGAQGGGASWLRAFGRATGFSGLAETFGAKESTYYNTLGLLDAAARRRLNNIAAEPYRKEPQDIVRNARCGLTSKLRADQPLTVTGDGDEALGLVPKDAPRSAGSGGVDLVDAALVYSNGKTAPAEFGARTTALATGVWCLSSDAQIVMVWSSETLLPYFVPISWARTNKTVVDELGAQRIDKTIVGELGAPIQIVRLTDSTFKTLFEQFGRVRDELKGGGETSVVREIVGLRSGFVIGSTKIDAPPGTAASSGASLAGGPSSVGGEIALTIAKGLVFPALDSRLMAKDLQTDPPGLDACLQLDSASNGQERRYACSFGEFGLTGVRQLVLVTESGQEKSCLQNEQKLCQLRFEVLLIPSDRVAEIETCRANRAFDAGCKQTINDGAVRLQMIVPSGPSIKWTRFEDGVLRFYGENREVRLVDLDREHAKSGLSRRATVAMESRVEQAQSDRQKSEKAQGKTVAAQSQTDHQNDASKDGANCVFRGETCVFPLQLFTRKCQTERCFNQDHWKMPN